MQQDLTGMAAFARDVGRALQADEAETTPHGDDLRAIINDEKRLVTVVENPLQQFRLDDLVGAIVTGGAQVQPVVADIVRRQPGLGHLAVLGRIRACGNDQHGVEPARLPPCLMKDLRQAGDRLDHRVFGHVGEKAVPVLLFALKVMKAMLNVGQGAVDIENNGLHG